MLFFFEGEDVLGIYQSKAIFVGEELRIFHCYLVT